MLDEMDFIRASSVIQSLGAIPNKEETQSLRDTLMKIAYPNTEAAGAAVAGVTPSMMINNPDEAYDILMKTWKKQQKQKV